MKPIIWMWLKESSRIHQHESKVSVRYYFTFCWKTGLNPLFWISPLLFLSLLGTVRFLPFYFMLIKECQSSPSTTRSLKHGLYCLEERPAMDPLSLNALMRTQERLSSDDSSMNVLICLHSGTMHHHTAEIILHSNRVSNYHTSRYIWN